MTAVTDVDTIHTCPRCHLRFGLLAELRDHFEEEHPVASTDEQVEPPPVGRLTVPLDPDGASPIAVAVATQLAGQLDFAVDLVAAPGLGLHAGATAHLQARARELRVAGTDTATWEVLESDRPAVAILDHVASTGADALCLATRSSHGLGHLLFGSVAEAVVLGAEVPALLVGPRTTAPAGPYRRVIACVDGSPPAATALAVAQRVQRAIGAELLLVEVVEPGVAVPADVYEAAELVRIAHALDPEPDGYEVLHGRHPAAAIIEYADRLDDAIVVTGTHGRHGLRSLLVGSVARGVVGGSRHPTLVVPPAASAESFPVRTTTT